MIHKRGAESKFHFGAVRAPPGRRPEGAGGAEAAGLGRGDRLPDHLLAAVEGCLHLDADERLPSAAAVRDLIQRVISAERIDSSLLGSLLESPAGAPVENREFDTTVDPTLLSKNRPEG